MKILVTGSKGQLGYDLIKRLEFLDIDCKGVDIEEFDITREEKAREYILNYKPTAIIHCAAYTAVDRAEENKKVCFSINVEGTKNILKICKELDIKMMYISTDYVFNGNGNKAFLTNDKKEPINFYGETKSFGEDIVKETIDKYFIVRISWVFGKNGRNFVNTILNLASSKDEIDVVYDQIGSPTYTYDLAKLLVDMIQTENYGIYHATNEGYCSWFEFAKEIVKYSGFKCNVKPVKTLEYKTLATRPHNSKLDKSDLEKNGFRRMRDWKEALKDYMVKYGTSMT